MVSGHSWQIHNQNIKLRLELEDKHEPLDALTSLCFLFVFEKKKEEELGGNALHHGSLTNSLTACHDKLYVLRTYGSFFLKGVKIRHSNIVKIYLTNMIRYE